MAGPEETSFYHGPVDKGTGASSNVGLIPLRDSLYRHIQPDLLRGMMTAFLRDVEPEKDPEAARYQFGLRARLADIYLDHVETSLISEADHETVLPSVLRDIAVFASDLNGHSLYISSDQDLNPTNEALRYYREFRTALLWAYEHLSIPNIMEPAINVIAHELRDRLEGGTIKDVAYSVIDIGCGPGRELPLYQKYLGNMGKVGAFDQSPAMVEIARGLNKDIDVKVGDLFNPDVDIYPPGCAMAVSAIAVLHHFDPEAQKDALKSMRRLVTDRGLLFLTARWGNTLFTDERTGLSYYQHTFKSLEPMLKEAGFRVLPASRLIRGHTTPGNRRYIDVLCEAVPRKQ